MNLQLIKIFIVFLFVFALSACHAPAIYVPAGQAVKLRQSLVSIKVWVRTKDGIEPCVMSIPEGWYCLPPVEEDE